MQEPFCFDNLRRVGRSRKNLRQQGVGIQRDGCQQLLQLLGSQGGRVRRGRTRRRTLIGRRAFVLRRLLILRLSLILLIRWRRGLLLLPLHGKRDGV